MISETFYLSDSQAAERAVKATWLALDELESIVGRFKETHPRWPGQLRGEMVFLLDENIQIRHHFSKKVLWKSND